MRMPDELRMAVDSVVGGAKQASLRRASAEISAAYKSGDFARPPLRSAARRIAYALVRMPATYAANVHVLKNLKASVARLAPRRVLDLGSGPGTSAWATAEEFDSIE